MSSTQQLLLGEGAGGSAPVYIEDVYSTYLYTGTGAARTITNNIDLSTKGGMVWAKARSSAENNFVFDTIRGATQRLITNGTQDQYEAFDSLTAFTSSGFTLGGGATINQNGITNVSWTFREQPKFFDIVTWTGNGASTRVLSHALGSVPGCIIIKVTSTTNNWFVYHRSLTSPDYCLLLNTTDGEQAGTGYTGNTPTAPTATEFTMGGSSTNASSATYVAYLFAHNAGGFGAAGTDNVISCGSFTTDGLGIATVSLGYEPQWVMFKRTNAASSWQIYDNMRGLPARYQDTSKVLFPNTSGVEQDVDRIGISATGFDTNLGANQPHIYIAIRRGPMKVPTDATKVFAIASAVSTAPAFVSNAVVDMGFNTAINAGSLFFNQARLTGQDYLNTRSTAAAASDSSRSWDYMNGMLNNQSTNPNNVGWMFGRAPGFMDVVCYTGVGGTASFNHNLTVIPELLIIKRRSAASSWPAFYNFVGSTFNKFAGLDSTAPAGTGQTYTGGAGLGGAPTATTFTVDSSSTFNGNGSTFLALLFATVAGVSKVGTYTGNGSTQTINCGFPSGVRWVLIKRADDVSGWYVYDTLRGMTTLTDPYLFTNAPAAAEVATLGSVTTVSTGFALNSAVLADINVNAATYFFLAIA